MTTHRPAWLTQDGFDIRCGWGPEAIEVLAPEVSAIVLVDVLRFTTALDVAVSLGARVYSAPWPMASTAAPSPTVEVADGSGPRRLSLSPPTLSELSPGDALVLPSPNGSHCSALAGAHGATVFGASLRDRKSVV